MPQVKGLRRGYALSVFRGSSIVAFPVDMVARFRGGGSAGTDVLIARASGPLVEGLGGVPLGASGSPVYIGGKLIGAISGTYPPDNSLVTITPIRPMLAMGGEPHMDGCPGPASMSLTPPVVAGISSLRALGQVEQVFGRKVVPSPPADGILRASVPSLRAGSPVGVAVMTGDIRIGYIGTATLLQGDSVYAFGHPVTFSGPVCMPLTSAIIFDTARGASPFKVGDIGTTIGTVTQDRSAGVFATLGSKPRGMVALSATVADTDRGREQTVNTQVVNIPDQLPRLALTAITETFARAMNRVGQGTADWEWSIWLASSEEPLTGSGRTSNSADIGFATALEIWQPLEQAVADGSVVTAVRMDATVGR